MFTNWTWVFQTRHSRVLVQRYEKNIKIRLVITKKVDYDIYFSIKEKEQFSKNHSTFLVIQCNILLDCFANVIEEEKTFYLSDDTNLRSHEVFLDFFWVRWNAILLYPVRANTVIISPTTLDHTTGWEHNGIMMILYVQSLRIKVRHYATVAWL